MLKPLPENIIVTLETKIECGHPPRFLACTVLQEWFSLGVRAGLFAVPMLSSTLVFRSEGSVCSWFEWKNSMCQCILFVLSVVVR
jgi:hypothetical protein